MRAAVPEKFHGKCWNQTEIGQSESESERRTAEQLRRRCSADRNAAGKSSFGSELNFGVPRSRA